MKENSRLRDLLEQSEDALLQALIDEAEGELGQAELKELAGEPPSAEYAKWRQALHRRTAPKRAGVSKRWLRVVVAAAIIAALLLLTVAAVRYQMLNFIERVYEQFTQLQPDTSAEARVAGWGDIYLPSYLPEGFFISSAWESGDTKIIEYTNSPGDRIIYYQYDCGSSLRLDSEDADKRACQVGGIDAWILEKDGLCTLYWWNETGIFSLEFTSGSVPETEIEQIAESLQYQEE